MYKSFIDLWKPLKTKEYRLARDLGFTGMTTCMTYLLQTFRCYCLFQCVTLPQVLEFASTDCIY